MPHIDIPDGHYRHGRIIENTDTWEKTFVCPWCQATMTYYPESGSWKNLCLCDQEKDNNASRQTH